MITWPDLVIIAIAAVFALKGFKRGFVAEIGGFIALAAAIWAALYYPGTFDTQIHTWFHLGLGSAHVVGMVVFAIIVYIALMIVSAVLSRIASLPIIGIVNSLGGALIGVCKVVVGVWIVLYVILFFPIPHDFREDLAKSTAVEIIVAENHQIDEIVQNTMPWFIRPFTTPLFTHHRV